ncbi:RING finger and transmembrane domain-containing protein 2 [Ixodes scapularis]|uniref:RING finger and transmembrane domain-containing protein 2 n=1 Tax=Ixodes scapularis TaxID=6945 RepID=UPI001A9F9D00|nr:RING finger and transmembrane domain-containing protein 2 [Ixodes scapularis]XP_040356740.1 RING finger and transmembrane domain-containing protein 2 [Ixodes scapularis]
MADGAGGEGPRHSTLRRVFGWSSVANSYGAGRTLNLTNPRNLRSDIQQVIMGLSPLIDRSTIRSHMAPSWLQNQRSGEDLRPPGDPGGNAAGPSAAPLQGRGPAGGGVSSGAYVIDMEADVGSPTPPLENLRPPPLESDLGLASRGPPGPPGGAHETGTETEDRWNSSPEVRALLDFVDKYLTFVLILLLKLSFDHRIGLLGILGLFITFCHANSVIKREVGKQGKRQFSGLFIVATNLVTCICFVYFVLADKGLAYALILVPPYSHPIGGMEVVWIVVVTDFVLKLITILVKALIVALPGFLSCFPRRGKYYLFVETSSQVYRSVVPMQHWLYYFSESYTGSTKIFSMMLSGAYLLCKCSDIVAKTKAWKKSLIQVLSNVNYGRTPTADQTKAAGESCAICQDEFKRPTVLACNHIFCEECVSVWFDRERTCPMCRAQIADDPSWKDGATSLLVQVF